MVFINISIQFQIVTRIRNLELRIRIRKKVSDPGGSGSTTLLVTEYSSSALLWVQVIDRELEP
jgi:hypothetical protein